MILHMFAVFDSATQMYGRPFFAPARAAAVRSFRDEVTREDAGNDLNKHREDFALYYLGAFDDNRGMFEVQAPECLIRGKDVE